MLLKCCNVQCVCNKYVNYLLFVVTICWLQAKSNSEPKTTSSSVDAYAQSWVFETTEVNNRGGAPSPYLSATADVSDSSTITQLDATLKLTNGVSPTLSARIIPIVIPQPQPVESCTSIIANPVVHIEEASDESTSNSNSDRKLCYMKSFSRTPSPVILSAASSQMSLNYNHNPPIYECLEKLTDPQVYRSRLNSALSAKEEPHYASTAQVQSAVSPRKSELPSPRQEPVHYASLMVELQEAITSKKDKTNQNITSPPQTISVSESSKSGSSQKTDAEFSKELEAALQLIQDLESPNTAETPSEPGRSAEGQRPLAVWRHSDASGSEKTLSAVGSLGELTSPLTDTLPVLPTHQNVPMTVTVHGKDVAPRRLVQCSSSQSTSGYSSPTRKLTPNNYWSTASSIDDSATTNPRHTTDLGRTLSFQIRNTNNSAVISLFPNPQQHRNASINSRNSFCTGAKSVTVVKINSDHDNNNLDFLQLNSSTLDVENNNVPYKNQDSYENSLTRSHKANVRRSTSMTTPWNVMSLLRKKKHVPKLSPELESAIIKSESLAHLTDTELLARLEKNKQIQRVRCGHYNLW